MEIGESEVERSRSLLVAAPGGLAAFNTRKDTLTDRNRKHLCPYGVLEKKSNEAWPSQPCEGLLLRARIE